MDFVCIDCGEPRRTFREVSAGTYQYDPCESCGAIGIERQGDLAPITRKKKANRDIYERSRYRGGKLVQNLNR